MSVQAGVFELGALVTAFLAIIALYVWVARERAELNRQWGCFRKEVEERFQTTVDSKLDHVAQQMHQLELTVTERFTAIETQLRYALPDQGGRNALSKRNNPGSTEG